MWTNDGLVYWCIYVSLGFEDLTHLPLVLHMYALKTWVNIGSGIGLMPVLRQTIAWTNADLLPNWPLGTYWQMDP